MVVANLSLAVGLLLSVFVHPSGQLQRDWLDAICGFLLGLSITMNFFGLWRSRRGASAHGVQD
jgi:zinc transporter ZupT